jgi:hypothetical protein
LGPEEARGDRPEAARVGAKILDDENACWEEKQGRRGIGEAAEVTMGEERCWGGGGNRERLVGMGLA